MEEKKFLNKFWFKLSFIPGGNNHHNALAAMTANLNPSAAAAMLFNPMLFQQNLNGMTNGNNNPTGSLPAIFAGGVSGIPSADDRVKLATLQNHLFYLQHQQRQQQANLLASATTSIVSEKQDEVSPTIRKTPEASEELPGGKTSPYETPHLGLKRSVCISILLFLPNINRILFVAFFIFHEAARKAGS